MLIENVVIIFSVNTYLWFQFSCIKTFLGARLLSQVVGVVGISPIWSAVLSIDNKVSRINTKALYNIHLTPVNALKHGSHIYFHKV